MKTNQLSKTGRLRIAKVSPSPYCGQHLIEEPAPVAESESTQLRRTDPAEEPEIVTELHHPNLTLAQLRARIRTPQAFDELTAVLDYENATLARAPFQTMLTNRITTAKAK